MQPTNENVPVITISSSIEGTPPKRKRSIGKRLFGGLMGNHGREGQSSTRPEPVARPCFGVNNPPQNTVMGNPDWVIAANPVPPRFSMYRQLPFKSDQFSSSGRVPQDPLILDQDSNSFVPSLCRIQSSPRYETWPFSPSVQNTDNGNGFPGSDAGGVGDGTGSSNSIPF